MGSVMPTYKIANFLGFNVRTGIKAKQITKHASAAKLQPPKTRRRSHLLTRMRSQQTGQALGSSALESPLKSSVGK